MGFISFVIFCYIFLLVSVHANRDSCCSLWILAIFSDLLSIMVTDELALALALAMAHCCLQLLCLQ